MLVDIINYQVKHEDVSLLVINNHIESSILNRIDKQCHIKLLGRKAGSKNPLVLLRLYVFLLFHHYDIVHLHNADVIKLLWIRRNYVRTVHNTNIAVQDYRWHKGVIAISDAVHDDLENRGQHGSVIINNGVNFRLIKKRIKHSRGKTFRMVQVSRILFEQKGQDILVEALSILKRKGVCDFHLDFIGTGPDEHRLKDLITTNGMENSISILGNQSREYIYEHLCDYDLFVQPSRFEGFGLTVAEAMGAGIPVLVSDNEGPLAVIDNGRYGFTFKNMSVTDCAAQIEDVMNNYPTEDFIEIAYKHVTSLYNIDITAQKYLDFYHETKQWEKTKDNFAGNNCKK